MSSRGAMLRKQRFQAAIRESLARIIDSGETVTKDAVISSAVYEDGAPVGKTTIYRRSPETQAFVHADLLKEIDSAIASQRRGSGRKTKGDKAVELRKKLAEARAENQSLVDAVVALQSRLNACESKADGVSRTGQYLEVELYVLASVVDSLAPAAIPDVTGLIRRFQKKHGDSPDRALADDQAQEYIAQVKNSRLVALNSGATSIRTG